jgi:hypothetical protein
VRETSVIFVGHSYSLTSLDFHWLRVDQPEVIFKGLFHFLMTANQSKVPLFKRPKRKGSEIREKTRHLKRVKGFIWPLICCENR